MPTKGRNSRQEHRSDGDRQSTYTDAQPAEESGCSDDDARECKCSHDYSSLRDSNRLRAAVGRTLDFPKSTYGSAYLFGVS